MANLIEEYVRRPERYHNIDGTVEMSLGVMMLGFALLGYLQASLPKASIWLHGWTSMLFMYLILAPALCLSYWGPKIMKKYVTYPRTGYVAYPKAIRFKAAVAAMLAGAVISAAVVYLLHTHAQNAEHLGVRLFMSAMLILPYAVFAVHARKQQAWKWVPVMLLASGLVALSVVVPGDVIAYTRPAFLFSGLVWLASGVASLYLYLRRTHAPGRDTL